MIYILFSCLIRLAATATYDHVTQCAGTVAIGESNPYNFTDHLDTATGAVFMIEDVNFQVTCCGVISVWKLNARQLTTIDLQIWRRTAGSYKLVGVNTVTPTTTGDFIYNVPVSERISVKHGDYIGWFASSEVISYNLGSSYPIMNRKKTGQTSFSVGYTLDWASVDVAGSNRQYAIGAKIIAGDTPTFNIGTNYAITISESTASGASVVILSVVDDDSYDKHTVNMLSTDNGYFTLDPTNLVIKTLQSVIPEAVYNMQLQVIDDCYLSSTASVTITVQNTIITVANIPIIETVKESDYQQRKLVDLDVTEITDGWYCNMEDANTVPFITRQVAVTGKAYGLYLNSWPQLDYDTKSLYILKIHCYDDEAIASVTATVSLLKNQAPVFNNLDANAPTVDATTAVNSQVVYEVNVTDPEGDTLNFSMTTTPTNGPFDILNSGKVVLTSNVLRHHTAASYDLSISVTDGYNTVGPRTLTVVFNNINDKPVITNLPASINVKENSALSKSLFQVNVNDKDTTDTRTFFATFDPPEYVKYFSVSNTGLVSTSATKNIDFDVLTDISAEMYIMVTDGKEHDQNVLTIQIQNVNEAPSFSQTHYSISRDEGVMGLQFPLTRYNIRDPDAGDTHTFLIDCGTNTSRIIINSTTGLISFSRDYDLDIAGTPTDFSCTVTVTDYDGLSDTCEIALNIRYVNEYTPTFPLDEYYITVNYYETIGTIIKTLTATDLDLTAHGTFQYSLTQTFDGGADLFGVLSSGSVYIKNDLSTYGAAGANFDVYLNAMDRGGRIGSTTLHITIPQAAAAPGGTTDKPLQFTETIRNTALLGICGVVVLAIIMLTVYICYNYINIPKCQRPNCNCCRTSPSKPKPKPPIKVPPPPPAVKPPVKAPPLPLPRSPSFNKEEMPMPKTIQLQQPGDERIAMYDKGNNSTTRKRPDWNDRLFEITDRNLESRDVNRWISDVDNTTTESSKLYSQLDSEIF